MWTTYDVREEYMKKLVFLSIVFFVAAGFLSAQIIDKPVATVNLIKTTPITQKQFRIEVEKIEKAVLNRKATEDEKKQILEGLIQQALLTQGAEKIGIKVSDSEVDSRLQLAKSQLGRPVTDDQFKAIIAQQTGMTFDQYKVELKKTMVQERYIMQEKKALLDAIKQPTDKEIADFYEQNSVYFINPEMIRMSHIFFDTRNANAQEKKKSLENAEATYKKLINGEGTFESLARTYSEDTNSSSKNGDVGFIMRNDQQTMQLFGEAFFQKLFSLKLGEANPVMESNVGYHIVRITDKIPKKFLELNDKIQPGSTETVRQRIISMLMIDKQQKALKQALDEISNELKKTADIKLFPENMTW